jgi:hypothetical protein
MGDRGQCVSTQSAIVGGTALVSAMCMADIVWDGPPDLRSGDRRCPIWSDLHRDRVIRQGSQIADRTQSLVRSLIQIDPRPDLVDYIQC